MPYLLLLLYPLNGLFSKTTWVSQYQKGKTGLDLNEARDEGFGDAVASAGPYANKATKCNTDSNRLHHCCHLLTNVEYTDHTPDSPRTLQRTRMSHPKLPIPQRDLGPQQILSKQHVYIPR